MKGKYKKLIYSLGIDAVGMATYFVPFLGEGADIVWAPISGYLVHRLYGNDWITALAIAEELIPLTDVVPTATLAWVYENFIKK